MSVTATPDCFMLPREASVFLRCLVFLGYQPRELISLCLHFHLQIRPNVDYNYILKYLKYMWKYESIFI